jgi:poly(glycerol-phosphate) alpha-glucosyltransferase
VAAAVLNLAQALERLEGVEVTVHTLQGRTAQRDSDDPEVARFVHCSSFGPKSYGYSPSLLRSLDAASPELTHGHGLWMYASTASRGWHRRTGRPYVLSPHGMLDPWALQHSKWKKRLALHLYESANLDQAACLHSLNASESAAIRALGLRNPICEIPNGVRLPGKFSAQPPWIEGVPAGARILLYLGRLHPKKQLQNLLAGWGRVVNDRVATNQAWWLLIAGWDQLGYAHQLEQLTRDLELQRVRFLGPLFGEDKIAALRNAEAFVLPSISEGLPIAVLEAWAYRLPVVMTAACNLPDGFSTGAALRMEPTPEGVAEGLRRLFALGPEERHAMGERGQRLVEERYTWSRIAKQLHSVYAWLLNAGPVPDCVRQLP